MLFMVNSNPMTGRPTELRNVQATFWDWIKPLEESGVAKACYVKAGRGAIVVFDVESHEMLHRLVNEWAQCIPAEFTITALIDRAYQEGRARGTLDLKANSTPKA